jgi:hypothetical protein
MTFLFQRVYCPFQEKLVYLQDVDTHPDGFILKKYWPEESSRKFLGENLPKDLATKIATG